MVNKMEVKMEVIDKLFNYFGLNINKSESIRQISLEIRVPYMTLSRVIKKLEKQKLILTKSVGKSIICSLNKNNNLTKQYLTIASESYKDYCLGKKPLIRKIYEIIKEDVSKRLSVILFGSYAKGKEQKHSDIDLAFISDSKQKIKKIQKEFRAIEQIYDIEINLMVFTEKQFSSMLRAKEENVGKQILKNHIILSNPELFWNIVYGVLT